MLKKEDDASSSVDPPEVIASRRRIKVVRRSLPRNLSSGGEVSKLSSPSSVASTSPSPFGTTSFSIPGLRGKPQVSTDMPGAFNLGVTTLKNSRSNKRDPNLAQRRPHPTPERAQESALTTGGLGSADGFPVSTNFASPFSVNDPQQTTSSSSVDPGGTAGSGSSSLFSFNSGSPFGSGRVTQMGGTGSHTSTSNFSFGGSAGSISSPTNNFLDGSKTDRSPSRQASSIMMPPAQVPFGRAGTGTLFGRGDPSNKADATSGASSLDMINPGPGLITKRSRTETPGFGSISFAGSMVSSSNRDLGTQGFPSSSGVTLKNREQAAGSSVAGSAMFAGFAQSSSVTGSSNNTTTADDAMRSSAPPGSEAIRKERGSLSTPGRSFSTATSAAASQATSTSSKTQVPDILSRGGASTNPSEAGSSPPFVSPFAMPLRTEKTAASGLSANGVVSDSKQAESEPGVAKGRNVSFSPRASPFSSTPSVVAGSHEEGSTSDLPRSAPINLAGTSHEATRSAGYESQPFVTGTHRTMVAGAHQEKNTHFSDGSTSVVKASRRDSSSEGSATGVLASMKPGPPFGRGITAVEGARLNKRFSMWISHEIEITSSSRLDAGLRDYVKFAAEIRERAEFFEQTTTSEASPRCAYPSPSAAVRIEGSAIVAPARVAPATATSPECVMPSDPSTRSVDSAPQLMSSQVAGAYSTLQAMPPAAVSSQTTPRMSSTSSANSGTKSLYSTTSSLTKMAKNSEGISESKRPNAPWTMTTTTANATGGFQFTAMGSATNFSTVGAFKGIGKHGADGETTAAPESADAEEDVMPREDPALLERAHGEDNEEITYSVKAKLYLFKKDEKSWSDMGTGVLRLMKNIATDLRRVVLRNYMGKVLLNIALYAGMKVTLQPKGSYIEFLAKIADDGLTSIRIRVKASDLSTLHTSLLDILPSGS